MRSGLFAGAAATILVLAASVSPSRAEVSAETDVFGNYVRMVVSLDRTNPSSVWRVWTSKSSLHPLNPGGQLNGDLYPAIRESNDVLRTPWVVWSRPVGTSYDLAFSRWNSEEGTWESIGWVQTGLTPGSDLGPYLAFDGESRPYLVWTRTEGGTSRVYLSLWLQSRWMLEYRLSDVEEFATATAIRLLPDRRIEVRYDTPSSRVTRILSFDRPWTITDDTQPFGRFRIDEIYVAPISPR